MLPQNDVLTYRQKSAELYGIIAGIQPIYDILSKADLKTRYRDHFSTELTGKFR